MKKSILLLLPAVICFHISIAQTGDVPMGTLKNHQKEILKIIKNEKGVIRGYDFGTPMHVIRETEDAKLLSEGNDFMIYQVVIDEDEYADIIYYLDENKKIKGFGIAFIESVNLKVEESIIDDFQKYFTERYGKFKTNNKNDEVWTSRDGKYTVEMGDSSEGGDLMEIEIEIWPVEAERTEVKK